ARNSQSCAHTSQCLIAVGFFSQDVIDIKKTFRHSFENSGDVPLAIECQGPVRRIDNQLDQFSERQAAGHFTSSHSSHAVAHQHAVATHEVTLVEQIRIDVRQEILE